MMDLHDGLQWLTVMAMAAGFWATIRKRDKDRDARVTERAVMGERVAHLEVDVAELKETKSTVYDKLEEIVDTTHQISERLARIETKVGLEEQR